MHKLIHIFLLSGLLHFLSPPGSRLDAASLPNEKLEGDIRQTLGYLPEFMKAFPSLALEGAWTEYKGLMLNPDSSLPLKMKELAALAVASQISCPLCVYSHTEFAKLRGASNEEIAEAISLAAAARYWSTVFNGMQLNEKQFLSDIRRIVSERKKIAKTVPPPEPIAVRDASSARKDIQQTFGFLPAFFKAVPDEGLAGAWLHMRNIETSADALLAGKYRNLIGLAVAAQIPCRFCILSTTEFAKLEGAKERELREAVAISGSVRRWGAYLNGLQINESVFRADIDAIIRALKTRKPETPTAGR